MNRDRKIFHGETTKRDWPDVRASYSAYCRGLGLPKLPPLHPKKLPATEEDLMERRAKYRVDTGPKKISMPPEELRNRRQKRHNNLVLHSEMSKRDWPNVRRSFSKFCGSLDLPLPVIPAKRYPSYQKRYRKEHREFLNDRTAERKRSRRNSFPEETRAAQRRESERQRGKPEFRILDALRRRVHKALKGICKSARTKELLGCPGIWLEVYLESLFRPGMTMENYGPVWHIDHIKPCAKFDLTDPEQQKICFHWTNLQPLFAKENMKKGATYAAAN